MTQVCREVLYPPPLAAGLSSCISAEGSTLGPLRLGFCRFSLLNNCFQQLPSCPGRPSLQLRQQLRGSTGRRAVALTQGLYGFEPFTPGYM